MLTQSLGRENPLIRFVLNRLTATPTAMTSYQFTEGMFRQTEEDPDNMDTDKNFKERVIHYASASATVKRVVPLTGRLAHDLSTLGMLDITLHLALNFL